MIEGGLWSSLFCFCQIRFEIATVLLVKLALKLLSGGDHQ